MTAIYDAYKPLRNCLRQYALETTLVDMWQLSQHIANPAEMSVPAQAGGRPYSLDGQLFPWDLPSIAREVLLHAKLHGGTKRLNSLAAVQNIVSTLRHTNNEGSRLRIERDGVFNELLRILHHQLPWQQGKIYRSLIRHLKIFGAPSVAPILEKHTGLTVREFFFLGFALAGHLERRFDINSTQDYKEFGITEAQATAFFSRLSKGIEDLRTLLTAQRVDETWEYVWNPLEATPLVALDPKHPNRLYCPVPELLLRRFSTGLYYDLVGVSGFDNAFGAAFEDYIGEVLAVAFQDESAMLLKEAPYHVGGSGLHHGPDWIVCDPSGNLVIECKAKRLTRMARQAGDLAVRAEIDIIAKAVVQNYKNIYEAQQGLSSWEPNDHPIIPLVITFEDWFILGPHLHEMLEQCVRSQLNGTGLDARLMEATPYVVMSCREFEECIGAIREAGIAKFFQGKCEGECLQWMWSEYMHHAYKGQNPINFHKAFEADWRKVIPEAAMLNDWEGGVLGE